MTFPVNSTTKTQTVYLIYTLFLKRTLSASVSGGPQHFDAASSDITTSSAWTPALSASLGWQRRHSTIAGRYTRTVTGGGGLIGTYHLNSAGSNWNWQYARTWALGATASYAVTTNATPVQFSSNLEGTRWWEVSIPTSDR